jgi:hypothetical protein
MASWLGSGNLTTNVFHHSSPRLGDPSSQIRIECYDCTVTADEYEKLPPEEKKHFAKCSTCGEIFDRRSLDEVLFHHTDHKQRPDIQYSGSEKLH